MMRTDSTERDLDVNQVITAAHDSEVINTAGVAHGYAAAADRLLGSVHYDAEDRRTDALTAAVQALSRAHAYTGQALEAARQGLADPWRQ